MAWLPGWSNRMKLTYDSSKIDGTLSDFPAMINVSSGTGRNSADATPVFDELAYNFTSIDDNFTGTNGSELDSDLWTVTMVGGGTLYINNNRARITNIAGTKTLASAISKYSASGDFDAQIDWNLIGGPVTVDRAYTNLMVNAGSQRYYLYYQCNSGTWLFNSQSYDGSYHSEHSTNVTLSSTKLRITRSGATWTTYYWNGSSWTLLKVSTYMNSTAPVTFLFYAENYTSYPGFVVEFDNFTVVSDGIVYDNTINRKKIAVTTSDGITQCPVEIERWDATNKKAILWTKIPSLLSSSDGWVYLYYDVTQPDNTTYVGDVYDAVARTVWDANFMNVWHLSEDPSGGSLCMKDSTSSVNNGTPTDMDATNREDGKIGKAIRFDGSTEHIDFTTINLGTNHSFSWICKADSTSLWGHIMSSDNTDRISIDAATINMYIDNTPAGISHGTTIDEWNYYTLIRNGSTMYLYANGSYVNSVSCGTGTVSLYNIAGKDFASSIAFFDGLMEEFRASNIVRPAEWIKADYYSCWNDLFTFGEPESGPAIFSFEGNVYEKGVPVARTVRSYRRDTGELTDETTSNSSTGYYYLETTYSGLHSIVCLDDEGGLSYNDLIIGQATASGIGA